MSAASSKFFARAVVVLIGLLLLARLIGMAVVPLMDTTEARYGEIGRKMAELNDWVTPWFDYGVPYWGKPPLAFWVTAISFKLFGVNEFDARLPHLVCSILVVGVVAWLAARRDRDAALPAVALISGSFLYFISAGAVMTDIELVLGTVLAMAGFWLAVEPPAGDHAIERAPVRWGAGAMFFGGLILGLLSKGPVAVVLAGAPLFLWTLYNRRWLEVWRRLPWVSGVVLTLLIALPWYWAAEHRTPGFLEYFLVGEHWRRFITPGWSGDRYGNAHVFPIGSIWVFALIDTLPWSLLLPLAIWRWRAMPAAAPPAARSDERVWQGYIVAWMLAPLLIFTVARNIIMTYVLPALPAATILAGGWLARQQRQGHEVNRWLSAGLLVTLLTMCGLAIVDLSQPDKMAHRSAKALLVAYDHATADGAHGNAIAAGPAPAATPLIFIWSRPFSSEFYSKGHATKVANENEAWRSIGPRAAFVATRWPDTIIDEAAHGAGETGGTARAVTRIGHYGDFDLLFIAAR